MSDDLTADVAALRQLKDAASPLPWHLCGEEGNSYITAQGIKSAPGYRNQQYIVAAVNLAPRLADAWEQASAMVAERDARELEELHRLRKMVSRDCVTPCSCCGTMLSWQFAGDGTNCLEVATGLNHACDYSIESAPPGTYRYLERQVAERDAEIRRLRRMLNPCPISFAHQPHDYCDGSAAIPNIVCPVCEGEGGWRDAGEPSTCDRCGGAGSVPPTP